MPAGEHGYRLSGAADQLGDVGHRDQFVLDREWLETQLDDLCDGIEHGVKEGIRLALESDEVALGTVFQGDLLIEGLVEAIRRFIIENLMQPDAENVRLHVSLSCCYERSVE